MQQEKSLGVSRRTVLKLGAGAAAGAGVLAGMKAVPVVVTQAAPGTFNEMTIAQMQAAMASGSVSSMDLVNFYLTRISTLDQNGPRVNSVIEVNPDAKAIAQALDAERRAGHVRGPLHGIPVLLKDNIDTHDMMQTGAGSLGLVGTPALTDAPVTANLRAAGAVILGKTGLSEWANFRSTFSTSGWSGRGGQVHNPYAIDRNPCGSSSGSGAATSANFTAVSIGTETDGSIVCPANSNGVVGIKPTVGLVSRGGVVPISHSQDTVGPHGRTVADAAATLTAIAQRTPDPRDPATNANRNLIPADYRAFLNAAGLRGARIGVARDFEGFSPHADQLFEDALSAMSAAGATLVDVQFPHIADINNGTNETVVLLFDFKGDVQKYFATRTGVPLAGGTLQDAINFNNAHAAQEMPFFGQELFELAQTFDITNPNAPTPLGPSYNQALAADHLFGATEGIDQLLRNFNLDAIVAPTGNPSWPTDYINSDHFTLGSSSPAAIAGYPIINVPMGMTFGVPVGISFMGTAFSEPKLITLASGFEAVTHARQEPKLLATLPFGSGNTAMSGQARRRPALRVAPHHL